MTWGIPVRDPQTRDEAIARAKAIKARFRASELAAQEDVQRAKLERERLETERERAAQERMKEINRRLAKEAHERTLQRMEEDYQRYMAMRALIRPGEGSVVSLRGITAECARAAGLTVQDLVGPRQSRQIVRARQMAFWIIRNSTQLSLTQVGQYIGGRDHSTILHGIRYVDKAIGADVHIFKAMSHADKAAAIWELIDPAAKRQRARHARS